MNEIQLELFPSEEIFAWWGPHSGRLIFSMEDDSVSFSPQEIDRLQELVPNITDRWKLIRDLQRVTWKGKRHLFSCESGTWNLLWDSGKRISWQPRG